MRQAASIHGFLTQFGFITARLLTGDKGGDVSPLGTIQLLLLGAPWPPRAEGEPAPAVPIPVPTSRATTG